MATDEVSKQVTDAVTQTNVKSWADVHMGVAASMAESHATTIAALNSTFVASMGSLQKRIVEPDISQSVAERLIGGAGQSAVQGDQAASLAGLIQQLGSAVAGLQQIIKAAQTTPPK